MLKRFLKFIPSDEALFLLNAKPKAFKLLTHIANDAKRHEGVQDGLGLGQCHLQYWGNYNFTEKEYRTAKNTLVKRGHIKIVETCRTRKKGDRKCKKRTTVSTLVELTNSNIYDINIQPKIELKDKKRATERATEMRGVSPMKNVQEDKKRATEIQKKGDRKCKKRATVFNNISLIGSTTCEINSPPKIERKNKKRATEMQQKRPPREEEERIKEKKDHPSIPSFCDSGSVRDETRTDDFFSAKEASEKKVEVCEGVSMSPKDLETCIKLKGSLEAVQETVKFIQNHEKRKHVIVNWPKALLTWKVEKRKNTPKENFRYAENLCREFAEFYSGSGWRCSMYRDHIKDQLGLLFEHEQGYHEPFFVPFSHGQFQEKCEDFICKKHMRRILKIY